MKMTVYGMRRDERELFAEFASERGVEITDAKSMLNADTAALAAGSDAVCIVAACRVTDEVARALSAAGVKYVLTRTAGYDHIDAEAVKRCGLRCANVPVYSRGAVAEHALMLTLALLRGFKDTLLREENCDFSLPRVRAKELGDMTAGIFGTGFIGAQTARLLSGFGCRVLGCARHPRPELAQLVTYVSKEELFAESDVIIFHCALNDGTRGIVNRDTIAAMRDGVYLVNAARGELMDFEAVLAGLKSGKIAGLATDVYTNEAAFIRRNCDGKPLDPLLAELLAMRNVIVTPHTAFYTDTAVRNLIGISFDNLREFAEGGRCANELFV